LIIYTNFASFTSKTFILFTIDKEIQMITLFGSHDVSDYEKWKSFFDQGINQATDNHGIQETKIYRTTDGSRVVVTHTFNTMEDVEKHLAMMGDPAGQEMAKQNGVVFPVTMWTAEEVG